MLGQPNWAKVVQTFVPQFLSAVETRLSAMIEVLAQIMLAMRDFAPGTF